MLQRVLVAALIQSSGAPLAEQAERRFVVHDVPWWMYVALRDELDETGVRMTYLKGPLEPMSPSASLPRGARRLGGCKRVSRQSVRARRRRTRAARRPGLRA